MFSLSEFLSCLQFFCRVGVSWAFSIHCCYSRSAHVQAITLGRLYRYRFGYYQERQSPSKLLDPLPGSYHLSYPLLQCSLSIRHSRGFLQLYPLELGSTTLHFDWLWFSIKQSAFVADPKLQSSLRCNMSKLPKHFDVIAHWTSNQFCSLQISFTVASQPSIHRVVTHCIKN